MKRSTPFVNYAFVVLCTIGIMFPALSFINESQPLFKKEQAIKTVTITFDSLATSDPAVGRFEPGAQADAAIDSFNNLWNNAQSGVIQLDTSKVSKSDLFSISALDSLLQVSSVNQAAKYLTIIKGIDPSSGLLKSYLALVDNRMRIIRINVNQTYLQDAIRCPKDCPQ